MNERINGGICDQFALEAYSIMDYTKWKSDYQRLRLTETEKSSLRENINRIRIIRNMCEYYALRIST